MGNWKDFVKDFCTKEKNIEVLRAEAEKAFGNYGVYPRSINEVGNAIVMMARGENEKCLVVVGEDSRLQELKGNQTEENGLKVKVCPLSNENCYVIRKIFPYTNPQPHKGKNITIGLGDRLGLASPGHIRLIRDLDVFPVLAQQSIRELNLTGRTYEDVISAAAWAVFQEGYTKGYGADGDHLKTAEEVKMSLNVGMTMITLDCSEHIDNSAAHAGLSELREKYSRFTEEERERWERKYLNRDVKIGNYSFHISEEDLIRMACVYGGAIRHTLDIYHNIIAKCGRPIDFEMSIDETLTPTSPASHYFVAQELIDGGVEITSLAPRFCGEFQKGIDYIGDLKQFTDEFAVHAAIADHFGYKISVHSGSDKFKVFPVVGEKTNGRYHLKTAGTNWLEAVRVIARHKPDLYRRMHAFALEHLEDAKKYYHIGAKVENIPALETLADSELPELMNRDDSRQVMHITYGHILQAKDENGNPLFKDELYKVLYEYEEEYANALKKHIGRHLEGLGLL
ncbi:hypothetical protein Cst_c08510 [Thermoclostridium stercorarium subsp. stercorarium DSM 8532]|jgi:hypothetical protein|uniref:Tagaturonate/fructuronate epimerase n=3 Tax=Thermoclostridium stercorarium TaxID=1510 RepID=L7VIG5_THES1|nr:tagaturonate epimerase family protein [Thermoclostridium stercorarium]AGC67850.1 hypothetical protein Cst_c08510 [Thermoclostridium stercorarium subsp. stercorarium DSM 8532]AGI38890.1 hypothetical protein Clst_0814 [Thermoclostridium stercorarium subsp. stercorarium DSM 8532]ANW98261.1 hypothetical protein CSTERTH_04030 [Thermoclostridium stercorarium subsp. thermolacticum DSM 2910]ANX00786.1 hypothetical protein CSTERLE_03915 [Thermoclostridium stercorarium subsp. leptospartum DSM 9219]